MILITTFEGVFANVVGSKSGENNTCPYFLKSNVWRQEGRGGLS